MQINNKNSFVSIFSRSSCNTEIYRRFFLEGGGGGGGDEWGEGAYVSKKGAKTLKTKLDSAVFRVLD